MGIRARRFPHSFRVLLAALAALVLFSGAALAQEANEPAPPPAGEPGDEGGGGLPPVKWLEGPATAELGTLAEIKVPEGYVFAGAADCRRLLEAMGNLIGGHELGFLAPKDDNWFVVFEFSDIGYVKDDEKDELDADDILDSLKANNKAANEERQRRGMELIDLVGWDVQPNYNPQTNNLEWAIRLRSKSGDDTTNYNVRILGRRGVMEAALVLEPQDLNGAMPAFRSLLTGYGFKEGQRYSEWRKGDKVAAVGLTALMVGGAAAVAAKTGFLAKFWKLLVLGALAVAGMAKKLWSSLFGRKEAQT